MVTIERPPRMIQPVRDAWQPSDGFVVFALLCVPLAVLLLTVWAGGGN